MGTRYEVTWSLPSFQPLYTLQTDSFCPPRAESFGSREEAEKRIRAVARKWPTLCGSIREVRADVCPE